MRRDLQKISKRCRIWQVKNLKKVRIRFGPFYRNTVPRILANIDACGVTRLFLTWGCTSFCAVRLHVFLCKGTTFLRNSAIFMKKTQNPISAGAALGLGNHPIFVGLHVFICRAITRFLCKSTSFVGTQGRWWRRATPTRLCRKNCCHKNILLRLF